MFDYNYQILSYIIGYAVMFLICFLVGYRQELVFTLEFRMVKRFLKKLEKMEAEARALFETALSSVGKPEEVKKAYSRLSDFFIIPPEEADPVGSIERLKHILTISRQYVEKELDLLPVRDEEKKATLKQAFLDVSRLSRAYKLVKHLYLSGVKSKSPAGLIQALSQLPLLKSIAERSFNTVKCYFQEHPQPIGLGAGPLAVQLLMESAEKVEVKGNAVIAQKKIHGKQVLLVKPKGPGARTDEDISATLLEKVYKLKKPSVIVVSAQPKLKGENGISVAQGVGIVAMYEPLKFELESLATRRKISLLSVLIKLKEEELSSQMSNNVKSLVKKSVNLIENLIKSLDEPIIVVGIGNTFMIPDVLQ